MPELGRKGKNWLGKQAGLRLFEGAFHIASSLPDRLFRVGNVLGALLFALPICASLSGCGPAAEPPPTFHPSTPAEAAALTDFTETVKPILRGECYRCHYGLNHKGGFNMGTRQLLLKGGKHGTAVLPGHPTSSLLIHLIRHEGPADHPMPMPQKGRLSNDEVAVISKWIADGAIMDR